MNPIYTLLRRFDLSLMNDKFILALNKSSERYNELKRNYPYNLDWFKNYVISNLIMSLGGRTKELEINDGTYYSIHEYLKKIYSDEIEERWYELRSNSLQEQIRKVLKEESRLKKTVENYINQFGFKQTAKMMGISLTKLVEISDHPIDSKLAHEILMENLKNKKLPREYKNFKIYPSMDGLVYWEMRRDSKHFLPGMSEHISVVATPFWDGNPWTPVDMDWFTLFNEDGVIAEKEPSGSYYVQLKDKTSFDTVNELFKWYVEYYLPVVYSTVMRDLLPEVYQEIDDKLDDKGGY